MEKLSFLNNFDLITNLEDIKAPECFQIEDALIERCSVPIFHDDQHGTAIVCCAAAVNALRINKKDIANIRRKRANSPQCSLHHGR